MLFFRALMRRFQTSYLPAVFLLLFTSILATAQQPPATPQSAPPPQAQQEPQPPVVKYDKSIFLKPIPSDQLTFLNQFSGVPTKDVIKDKQFRKLMKSIVPDCMFHYGKDMPLSDALELVFKDSPGQVQIRDNRYMLLSSRSGPYLAGKGFIWIDMQDGIGLGGFYFHPTNGEPTPSLNVFSRQVKEETLSLRQLPPAFVDDLVQWSTASRVPPVLTSYFLTGSNKKILLEHDEDYCTLADGSQAAADSHCEEMDADAADLDMNAASYLDQTHHATNATAWMITNPDQVAWLQVRATTCGPGPNQVACRIRMTRERTRVIMGRPSMSHGRR